MVHRINKRKLWLYSAIAANLGIGGYLLHKHLKKPKSVIGTAPKQIGGASKSNSKSSITKPGIFDLVKNRDRKGLIQLARKKQNLIAVLLGLGLAGGLLYKKVSDKIKQAKIEEGLPQAINGGGKKSRTTYKPRGKLTRRSTSRTRRI